MTIYRASCRCDAPSPRFVSSELAERWLIGHVAKEHPERAGALRLAAARGEVPRLLVAAGGEVVRA